MIFSCLIDELQSLLRDTADKKGENIRRRRRRDLLRLQLIRLFEVIAYRGTLSLTFVKNLKLVHNLNKRNIPILIYCFSFIHDTVMIS